MSIWSMFLWLWLNKNDHDKASSYSAGWKSGQHQKRALAMARIAWVALCLFANCLNGGVTSRVIINIDIQKSAAKLLCWKTRLQSLSWQFAVDVSEVTVAADTGTSEHAHAFEAVVLLSIGAAWFYQCQDGWQHTRTIRLRRHWQVDKWTYQHTNMYWDIDKYY